MSPSGFRECMWYDSSASASQRTNDLPRERLWKGRVLISLHLPPFLTEDNTKIVVTVHSRGPFRFLSRQIPKEEYKNREGVC